MSGRRTSPIAVCIPVKDRISSLKLAVASVFAQNVLPREVIIVDDGSCQPVTQCDLPAAPDGMHITIFRNQVNLGGGKSRNIAFGLSKQPIIAFLDSDDLFLPEYIEKIERFWQSELANGHSALTTGFFWCNDAMKPYRMQKAASVTTLKDLLTMGNVLGGCSVFSAPRERLEEVGGFLAHRGIDDWNLFVRLASVRPIASIPEPLVLYRAPAISAHGSMTANSGRQILALIRFLRDLPQDSAKLAQPHVRLLVAHYLAMAGRRRSAVRQLFVSVRYGRRVSRLHVQTLVLIGVGPSLVKALFAFAAWVRARTGRTFRKHHIPAAQAYVRKLMNDCVETPSARPMKQEI